MLLESEWLILPESNTKTRNAVINLEILWLFNGLPRHGKWADQFRSAHSFYLFKFYSVESTLKTNQAS